MDLIIISMPLLLKGLYNTIMMSIGATLIATMLGIFLALIQVFGHVVLRVVVEVCLYLIRGVPLLVLLFTMYYALLYVGLQIDPLSGGTVVIGVYFAAFMAEVFRGGLLSIAKGQWEAGYALGLRTHQVVINILAFQALRIIGAPYVNTVIMVVKGTSLVAVIGVTELTFVGRQIVERTLEPFLIFGVVAGFYVVICYSLSLLARYLERKIGYVS
jgi:polar amino acid transport system permease protein